VGVAIFGAAVILLTVAIRMSSVRSLREHGRAVNPWRYLARSPTIWVGLIMVVSAFSTTAATVLIVMVFGVFVVTFGKKLWTEHVESKATS
jgi:hypothetical protein